ncbi:MAG: S8 family serine peptidase [Bacteroidota bacterium]
MRIIYTLGFLFAAVQMFGQGPAPRMETNLDDVYSMYNLSGDGVLAVVIDRGIDYRHPDFIDENGNTRIKYIFDMIDDSGVSEPGNTYGVGTIWDEAEINQALANNTNPPLTMDRYGHGTATAGIFGGDGSGTNDLAFQGVAPGVNYIIIKLTQDPFPAFGNQPAQAAFFDPTYIPVALDFAHDKITELNMPSVTLLNLGSTGGPTDGTSLITREIDQFIAQGHVFVCGVGDDGGGDNHASGTITQGQTIELQINKVSAGFLRLDLWYSEDDRFTVSFERPDGTTEGPFAAPGGPGLFNDQFMSGISMFHRGADVEFFGATSNRRELLVDFSGATGVYKVILTGATISDGSFNATLNPGNFNSNNAFLTFVTPGTSIADYAASIFGITPTDYVVDNTWTDIDGIPRAINGQGNPGELWLGSSEGPTQDGRRGVDFATPGEVCIAAYSPDTYYENFSFNVVQGSNGLLWSSDSSECSSAFSLGHYCIDARSQS